MNTTTKINDKVKAAREKVTALSAAAQNEKDKAQAELDQLEAEAQKANQAEAERTAKRGRIWASHYLTESTERSEQKRELRAAERALREALANEPWVQALKDWHMARRRADLVHEREDTARRFLDLPPANATPAPESAAHWRNGTPSPEFLLRPLLGLIDSTVDTDLETERTARADDLHGILHAPDGKADPLANLPTPRAGTAVRDQHRAETWRRHTSDGTVILAHRNLDEDRVTYTLEDGTPYQPPAPTDPTTAG